MHKLGKGLKKKIKGKKGKEKEDDLFDPAILEQYRRDKAAAALAAAAKATLSGEDCDPSAEENGSPTANEPNAAAQSGDKKDSEEWQKFKLLTSGVDSILQKSQEDLGRIKKTSYYQRNKKPETPTPGEETKPIAGTSSSAGNSSGANNSEPTGHKTKWIGFEEGAKFKDLNTEEAEADHTSSATGDQSAIAEEVADPQFDELRQDFDDKNENEDDEDIFNTEYVDVATSGELKLAFVPDSPTLEAAGDDPFDTSDVEKLVGPLPVIKKKKALVSIGAAVEILTAANAADQQQKQHHQLSTGNRQRIAQPPTEIQLLCCFDDNEVDQKQTGNSAAVTPLASHTEASSSAQQTPHGKIQRESGEAGLRDILAEFDVIPDSVEEPIDDEFVKPSKPSPAVQSKKPELLDEEDFEFEALAYESLAKQPHPQEEEEEDDPFDTSSVEKVLKKDPVETGTSSRKPPPSRPTAPPTRPPPPPSATAIAAVAAAIDRPSSAPTRPPVPGNPTVPSLQPQDSFDALFLDASPTEKENPTESRLDSPVQVPAADPFDTSVVDPFDTSAVDPFDTLAVDPFDTSAVRSVDISASCISVANSPLAHPSETQLQVTSFVIVDDSPVEDEVDPFDTSAVEKILN